MFLKRLKQNGIDSFTTVLVILTLMSVSMFLPATSKYITQPENGTVLFNSLYVKIFGGQISIATKITSIFIIIAEFYALILMNINHELTRAKNNFFLLVYGVLSLSYIPFNTLLPEQIANFFITLGFIKILSSHGLDKAEFNFFDTGLLFAVAALFCKPAIFTFLIGITALIIYRPYRINEFAVFIIGFLTPLFFYLSGYFIAEGTLRPVLESYSEIFSNPMPYKISPTELITLTMHFVTISIMSILILQEYPKYNLFSARTYQLLFIFFIMTVILAATPYFPAQTLKMALMPLTMLYVSALYDFNPRRTVISEIFFTFFLLVHFGMQILWYVL